MTAREAWGALLLGALLLVGCGRKPGPDAAAKAFFDRVAAGRVGEAYDSAAFGFQIRKPRKFFETMVTESELAEIASATFAAQQIDGRIATVRGEFTTRAGGTFPLLITLVQDSGAWRVYSFKPPREKGATQDRFELGGRAIGLAGATNRQPIPDDAALNKLILDALTRFGDAVKARSFNDFFDHISRRWQLQLVHGHEPSFDYETAMRRELKAGDREYGSTHFDRAFRSFFDRSIDFAGLAGTAPVLAEAPRMSTDGWLLVSGYVPAPSGRVDFALKFVYEPPTWRIFGIEVSCDNPKEARQ